MILDLFKKKGPSLDEAGSAALEQALAQRAKMDLVFEEGVTTLTGLSCSLSAIGKDSLRLDVYGVGGPGNFSGRRFECFFRIREGKGGVGFYGFSSRVEQVRQARHGGVEFVAAMPAKVARSQRRRSVRVRPEIEWFEALLLWKGAMTPETDNESILLGLTELRQAKACRLENLSAGGMGVHYDRQFCIDSRHFPAVGDEYTVYLRFAQEMRNQPRELWLSGRVVRSLEDPVSKDLDVGIEFLHVGRKGGEEGAVVRWVPVADNVTEELINRIFEWHAAMCRERAAPA